MQQTPRSVFQDGPNETSKFKQPPCTPTRILRGRCANWQRQQVEFQGIAIGNQAMINVICMPCWQCNLVAATQQDTKHTQHTPRGFKAPASMCLYDTLLLTCSKPLALFAAMSSTFNFLFNVLFHIPLMVLVYHGSRSERFARPRLVMSPLFSNFVVKWREQVPDQKHLQGHARNMCKATLGTSTWAIALLEGASFCAWTIYM